MDQRFLKAISQRPATTKWYSLNRILLFTSDEWVSFIDNRLASILVQWITVFLFILWSVDSLANHQIRWDSLQYPIVFMLFSSLFLVRTLGRQHLVPHLIVVLVMFIDLFVLFSTMMAGSDIFALFTRSLILYTSPVAIINAVVFKPRIGLTINLLLVMGMSLCAASALVITPEGFNDLHLVTRIFGVLGFYLWFAVALYSACNLYLRHRLELVEVHHLVAEMERNQRLNEENARIRDDLVRTQRVQMVDSMTSTMAHEVNQPISCANNYIQAARRWLSRPEPEVNEAIVSLSGAQEEIVRVSERVMSVRRLMQRLSSEYTSIDLGDLLGQLEMIVRRDLGSRQIELVLDVPTDDDEEFFIFGCEEELIQVLMNLISNATDALAGSTGENRPEGNRIELGLSEADLGEIKLWVGDNGCGIAPADLSRVFDRLFSTKAGGSGLGLALSQRIVANHGGTIAIESQPGTGTTVIMRFPRAEMRRRWGM